MNQIIQSAFISGLIFLGATSFGQTTEMNTNHSTIEKRTPKTYLDLMINMVSTNLNYGESNNSLSRYKETNKGIQGGVSFQAGITSSFSLVSEFYFMRKGGKLEASNPLTISESTLQLNTLELPVLARFHFGNFYLNAGPSIAYNLSGKRIIDGLSTRLAFKNSADGFKRFDAGFQFGGGIELPFKEKRIALDIRYNYGLINIANDKEMYNRTIMISVHFSRSWKTNPFEKRQRN